MAKRHIKVVKKAQDSEQKVNYEKLSDDLLDYMVNDLGSETACEILFNLGYSQDQLYYLGFSEEDIEGVSKAEDYGMKEQDEEKQLVSFVD